MSKNYEEMSDGAINLEVHYLANDIPKHHAVILTKDYCNNPSDAWPIIIENKICINAYGSGDGWSSTTDTSFFVDDDNPLRAAMICFLKMKDNEQ